MRRILTNNKNKGKERKRVLTPANQDVLLVTNNKTITTLVDFDAFLYSSHYSFGSNKQIFMVGSNRGRIDFYLSATGLGVISLVDSLGVSIVTAGLRTFSLLEVTNAFWEIKNSKIYLNGVEEYDLTPYNAGVLNISTSDVFAIGRNSYLSTKYADMEAHSSGLNGETFSLNEGNGVGFKGSLGTIGSCGSSSANLENYVNQVMIKRI